MRQCRWSTPSRPSLLLDGIIFGLTVGFGILLVSLSAIIISRKWKKDIQKHLYRKHFQQNQCLLLEQLIMSDQNANDKTRTFCLDELEKATNNIDSTYILGHGGHGMVVAIERYKHIEEVEISHLLNIHICVMIPAKWVGLRLIFISKEKMAFTGVIFTKPFTGDHFTFRSFCFTANHAGQLLQTNPGVLYRFGVARVPAGSKLRFETLDFVASWASFLKLKRLKDSSPPSGPVLPLGLKNCTVIMTNNLATDYLPSFSKKNPRRVESSWLPQTVHELGPWWVGFIDKFVQLPDSELESSGSFSSTSQLSRDVFVMLNQEMEAERQAREAEDDASRSNKMTWTSDGRNSVIAGR
uniref:Uncharacterized protein n=1 Tax=Oryza punctata TaxID=4537 RepID=A0A0E0KNX7_ORYPU